MAPSTFDRRIVPEQVLDLIRACQRRSPSQLAGGAALAGVHLRHRLSNDIDLFCHELSACRDLVRALPEVASEAGVSITVVRDAGSSVRARIVSTGETNRHDLELDIVHETSATLEAPLEGVDGITGINPGVLSWLLAQFPTTPLPMMLEPLSSDDLRAYRDGLAERFRRLAVPGE